MLIALPYHWAALMATPAMRAGKDVYCEKPIAITVRDGRNMADTAKRYSRIYQAGTQQRSEYGGKFRLACELIRNGRIGQLKEVYPTASRARFTRRSGPRIRESPSPKDLTGTCGWGRWPGVPTRAKPGQTLPGYFVGDVNWAPHHYDIIQWTINPDPAGPIEVSYEAKDGKPENAVIHYRYSNGVLVHSTSYPGEPVGDVGGACFVGTEGRIAVDRDNIVSYPATILTTPLRPSDHRVYHADSHSGNFLECVRTRQPTICNPETAVYTMNAILIGGICLVLKRTLSWDPVKAEFAGDAEANRLLAYAPTALAAVKRLVKRET